MSKHQHQQAPKPPVSAPTECDGCASLRAEVARIADRLTAAERHHPVCTCGKFVTRRVSVSHPVGGSFLDQWLCDICEPRNPYSAVPGESTIESIDYVGAELARRLNAAATEVASVKS